MPFTVKRYKFEIRVSPNRRHAGSGIEQEHSVPRVYQYQYQYWRWALGAPLRPTRFTPSHWHGNDISRSAGGRRYTRLVRFWTASWELSSEESLCSLASETIHLRLLRLPAEPRGPEFGALKLICLPWLRAWKPCHVPYFEVCKVNKVAKCHSTTNTWDWILFGNSFLLHYT